MVLVVHCLGLQVVFCDELLQAGIKDNEIIEKMTKLQQLKHACVLQKFIKTKN